MAADAGAKRSYTPGNFALDLEGYSVAFLKKFSGLSMQGDVVANDLGPDNVQKKHIANIKWTPGKATIGIGMGKAMYDSFTWKCGITPDQIGSFREPTKQPTKVTVPDLKLAISYADHQPWADWAKKWFVDGHHLEGDELQGRIVFLGPDMQKELGE